MSIYLPEDCPRGLDSCEAYATIQATEGDSFFCCGMNDGVGIEIPTDRYNLCFRNPVVDQISCNDKRDLAHQMSVIAQALSIIEEMEIEND